VDLAAFAGNLLDGLLLFTEAASIAGSDNYLAEVVLLCEGLIMMSVY
jgi:hypothetical protein